MTKILLYNYLMYIYGFLSTIIFLALLPFYYVVRAVNRKFLYGWREKLGHIEPQEGKIIMLHGVSVGEIIALENLIRKIKDTFPGYKIMITTGTKTGQDIAQKKYSQIADYITYFPFDVPFAVRAFLNKAKPSVILMAETEIWPTFAFCAHKKNIPLYIINGRISDSTFKLYRFLKPFFKNVFSNYTGIFTQSEDDRQKFIRAGAPPDKTEIMGNLKFDIKKTPGLAVESGYSRIIIAGSTHKGEDEIVLDIFGKLKTKFPDIKLILAPRHPQRVPAVSELVKNTGLAFGLRSKKDNLVKKEILLLDTMGELSRMYSTCDFAFIGGSFNKTGGHNPLEATAYGKPAISGPSIHNFKDIYGILTRTGAGKVVKTPQELQNHVEKLLSDPEFYQKACTDCEKVFLDQQGALEFVIARLMRLDDFC